MNGVRSRAGLAHRDPIAAEREPAADGAAPAFDDVLGHTRERRHAPKQKPEPPSRPAERRRPVERTSAVERRAEPEPALVYGRLAVVDPALLAGLVAMRILPAPLESAHAVAPRSAPAPRPTMPAAPPPSPSAPSTLERAVLKEAVGVPAAAPGLASAHAPTASRPAPASTLAPAVAAFLAEVERQPAVRAMLSGGEARLSLRTERGEVIVHVHVHDRQTDVRLIGVSPGAVFGAASELRAALAARGLSLGGIVVEPSALRASAPAAPTDDAVDGRGETRDDAGSEDSDELDDRRHHVTA